MGNLRSRAAILPYPGDPFLLNYWLGLFDKHWGNEIDKLYIYLNSPVEKPIVDYIRDLCLARPNINFQYNPTQIEHGDVINRTLDIVQEKYVMLVEDDGFIFKSGAVNSYFEHLENGGFMIVGSQRSSCHPEIENRAKELWGISYEGEGDTGPNFWPNFFFCQKELLLQTDRNFAAKAWYKGDKILALGDYEVKEDVAYADTFVNTSLQLRAMVPITKIMCIPQYHGHPDDLKHYEEKYEYSMFNGRAPWCHIGSLSSGVGGVLRDDQNRALSRRFVDPPGGPTALPTEWCQSEFEQREWERRAQWWLTFWEHARPTPYIQDYYDLYGKAVSQLIEQYKLRIKKIRQRQDIYATLGL